MNYTGAAQVKKLGEPDHQHIHTRLNTTNIVQMIVNVRFHFGYWCQKINRSYILTISIMGSPACEPWRWSRDIQARVFSPWAMFDRVKLLVLEIITLRI